MSVPAVVEDTLRKLDINYAVLDPDNVCLKETLNSPSAAKSMIMKDGKGKVQVIYPANAIMDIDYVRRLTNRELNTISNEELQSMCKTLKVDNLPVVPLVLGIDTIIDKKLLDIPELQLTTGSENNVINMEASQFKKMIDEALLGDIAITEDKLQHGNLEDVDDITDISTAVANFTQLRMKNRLEETLEFPPLPDTAQRIIKLRVDPKADIQDLTDIVETDPPLAGQVVSWAASPYYAAPGKIKSVHDAIVRVLGFDLVLNLSLGLALGKTLSLPKDAAKGFTPYWEQAVYTATTVEALVSTIPPKDRPSMGLAYLSGLLSNFGYLILAEVFPPHFSNICRYQEANPYSNHAHIERHLLGVTREQLACWLMRLWGMPEEVCVALRYQNEALYEGEYSEFANVLFIAQRLLRQQGIGDAPLEPIPQALFDRANLDRESCEEVIAKVMESASELNTIAANMAA